MVGMLVFIWYGMEILVFHQLALSGIALTASPKKDINKHMHMLPHLPPYTQTKKQNDEWFIWNSEIKLRGLASVPLVWDRRLSKPENIVLKTA